MTALCPKCGDPDGLAIERRPNGNASCSSCGWSGPAKLCFPLRPEPDGEIDWSDRSQLTVTLYDGDALQIGRDTFIGIRRREGGGVAFRVTVSAPRDVQVTRMGPSAPVRIPSNAFRTPPTKKS